MGDETARPFHLPPQGAMRFNPIRTRRILRMHPWVIPIQSSRIADLDDPMRALWAVRPPPRGHHVLGETAFEPDPLTNSTQWEMVTVRIKGEEGTSSLGKPASDAGTQRIVILRPFASPSARGRSRTRTYLWEPRVREEAIQVLDGTVDTMTLRDGDVIVLTSEGVAHAYEFELGAPIYDPTLLARARPPQVEDYAEAT
jgi:hypothetical protein